MSAEPALLSVAEDGLKRSRNQVQYDDAAQFSRQASQVRFDQVKDLQDTGQTLNDIMRETGAELEDRGKMGRGRQPTNKESDAP